MALLHVDFFSEVLLMRTEMDVILPQRKYDGEFQVLYLLHGMSDDQTAWQRFTSIERYVEQYDLAVVMPTTYLGWYTNMHMGERYFDFITQELPHVVRGMFPHISQKREDTFVSGLSMGGYGALKCGLLRPDLYSHAAPLSGALHMQGLLKQALIGHHGDAARTPVDEKTMRLLRDVCGNPISALGPEMNLMLAAGLVAPKDRPRVFIWCGTEDFLYQQNTAMRDHLQRLGYDVTYSEGPGDHSWFYWDREIQNVLKWLPLRKVGDR